MKKFYLSFRFDLDQRCSIYTAWELHLPLKVTGSSLWHGGGRKSVASRSALPCPAPCHWSPPQPFLLSPSPPADIGSYLPLPFSLPCPIPQGSGGPWCSQVPSFRPTALELHRWKVFRVSEPSILMEMRSPKKKLLKKISEYDGSLWKVFCALNSLYSQPELSISQGVLSSLLNSH